MKNRTLVRVMSELSDADLIGLWKFRLKHVSFKPDTSEEVDRSSFILGCRKRTHAVIIYDEYSRICGMNVFSIQLQEFQSRKYWEVLPEYGFIDQEHQGRNGLPLIMLKKTLGSFLKNPTLPLYCFCWVYLPSYLYMSRYAPRIVNHFNFDQNTCNSNQNLWERALLDAKCQELGGARWDPQTQLFSNWVYPLDRSERVPASAQNKKNMEFYEKVNPRWREGYSIGVLLPLKARELPSFVCRVTATVGRRFFKRF